MLARLTVPKGCARWRLGKHLPHCHLQRFCYLHAQQVHQCLGMFFLVAARFALLVVVASLKV